MAVDWSSAKHAATGAIRAELGGRLDLSGNQLSGEVPPELGTLTQLTRLDLSGNQLSGEVPPELGTLTQLTRLDLSGNQLSGEVPPELGTLTQLTRLDLSGNQLSGEIPPELGALTQLTRLDLSRNYRLDLSRNGLSGEIPPELGTLTRLDLSRNYRLDLSRNYRLDLSRNGLSGEIPPELGTLTQLTWLDLSDNQLSGEIPPELGTLTQLTRLELHHNQLSGEIPPELGTLTQLTRLDLSRNHRLDLSRHGLSGEIPPELGTLTQLTWLDLSENQLSGEIPPELGTLTQLTRLDLSRNHRLDLSRHGLSGEIPPELGTLTQLTWLDLSENQLSGEIPPELGTLTQLTWLDLSGNKLGVDLSRNKFRGEIPPELGTLTQLRWLDLSGNELDSYIPADLGKLTQLSWLNLSDNALDGHIPADLGKLTQLSWLNLSENQLSGAIPADLGSLTELISLRLDHNSLSGEIPSELAELRNLESLILRGRESLPYQDNEDLQGGRAHVFNLNMPVLSRTRTLREFGMLLPSMDFARLGEPTVPNILSAFTDESATEKAIFHVFSLHPVELYDRRASEHVIEMFPQPDTDGASHECTEELHLCGKALPFNLELLTELKMEPTHTFKGRTRKIGDQSVREFAVLIGTVICFVYHTETAIATNHADDAHLYKRVQWALSIAEAPPRWVDDALPYNSEGALYRAVWIWMYQRYIWRQWAPDSRGTAKDTEPTLDASKAVPHATDEAVEATILHFAVANEMRIEEYLRRESQSSRKLTNVVDVMSRNHPRVFTFSVVQIEPGTADIQHGTPDSSDEGPDGGQSPDPQSERTRPEAPEIDGDTPEWREHFSTTAHALDILNALDDGVHFSKAALEEFEDHGVYRTLHRTHLYLRELMRDDALKDPAAALSGERFQDVTRQLVDGLSKLDLELVRVRLTKHQPLRGHEEGEDKANADWLDAHDGDEHLFVQAGPDSAIFTTADDRHIDDIVAMEIALQSAWSSFATASGRVLEAHESEVAASEDAGGESGAAGVSPRDPVGGHTALQRSRATIAASWRTVIDWLRPEGDDGIDASDQEDALLDAMSDELLRVTRWRGQVSGWRRIVFERLRHASGLDENIDAFYRASEESVKRSEVLREKVRAQRQSKFQAALALAALALAAVVLGEIAISIEAAPGPNDAVPRAAAWLVGLGLVVIAWFIVKSLSDQPSKLSRGAGWFWERMSESVAALLLVGLMAAFLHENLGGPPEGTREWLGRAIASLAAAMVFGVAWRVLRERWRAVLMGLLFGFAVLAAALVWAPDFLDDSPFWIVDGPLWTVWTGVVALAGGVSLALLLGWLLTRKQPS